jgi:toxin-antitoxin system PIN domain toxin
VILPDVNTLVYAYRREAAAHEPYRSWLAEVLGGSEEVALVDHVLIGFVRVVTNPRIFAEPAPIGAAVSFVEVLRAARPSRHLGPTAAVWEQLSAWAAVDAGLRGNLVPDAYLAAVAVVQGCRLATADRGFARFDRLEFFDPIR